MSEKQPYLTDVPVCIYVWIRPECQKKQFDVIRQAKPSVLFIASDGGRNDNEWAAIHQNREMIESGIDWNCSVHKIYADENLGMYKMSEKTTQTVWSFVDRCIFLEDDEIPSVSFFPFCAELLEKYKDDTRVSMIAGYNALGVYEGPSSDYFFTPTTAIWGFALWKRTFDEYFRFDYAQDPYILSLLKDLTKKDPLFWKKIKGYAENRYYQGHIAYSEFFLQLAVYAHHQLVIMPVRNMITNIGYGEDSTHSSDLAKLPRSLSSAFNLPRYELSFPLKHPYYVIQDNIYDRKVHDLRQERTSFQRFCRNIDGYYRYLKAGGSLKEGISRKLNRILKKKSQLES